MEIKTIKTNKPIKVSIISFSVFFALYLGMAIYFSSHFYFGSAINGIDSSGKTVGEIDKEMLAKSKKYKLDIVQRSGVKEQINAVDINLKYNSSVKGKIQELKDSQNSFMWIYEILGQNDLEINDVATYDEKLLKERFDKLSCFDSNKVIEPINPSFKYTQAGYEITGEVMGNKVSSEKLQASIANAILKEEATLNFDIKNVYINPKYTSTSKEVINTKNLLNKYMETKITYTFTGGSEVIDKAVIHDWINVDQNLAISFDEDKIKSHLAKINDNYDTYGKTREFVTSLGTTINVSGGDYGWLVDRKGEVADIIRIIKAGQTIAKEPIYIYKGMTHEVNDIGNTYVEINLTKQHMWFYKNGTLIASSDVVTGNTNLKRGTPTGVYSLKYKVRDAKLSGEGYSTSVDVFMPFNGNIGIHDASWKKAFGGNVYLTNGSHGCINTPPSVAKKIFNNIEENTPVICYIQ